MGSCRTRGGVVASWPIGLAEGRVVRGVGLDPGASVGARSGAGATGCGGDARRWWRLRHRSGRVPGRRAAVRVRARETTTPRVLKLIGDQLLGRIRATRLRRARGGGRGHAPGRDQAGHRRDAGERCDPQGVAAGNYKRGYGVFTARALAGSDRRGARGGPQDGERRVQTRPRITSRCSVSALARCQPRISTAKSWWASAARRTTSPPTAAMPGSILGRLSGERDRPPGGPSPAPPAYCGRPRSRVWSSTAASCSRSRSTFAGAASGRPGVVEGGLVLPVAVELAQRRGSWPRTDQATVPAPARRPSWSGLP